MLFLMVIKGILSVPTMYMPCIKIFCSLILLLIYKSVQHDKLPVLIQSEILPVTFEETLERFFGPSSVRYIEEKIGEGNYNDCSSNSFPKFKVGTGNVIEANKKFILTGA
jgi:hypothetical protein